MSYGQYSANIRPYPPSLPAKTDKAKHVFGGKNSTDVEHVWAHPLQKDGSGFAQTWATNPGKNFYFKTSSDGARVLYSYRDDYPVANLIEIGRRKVYLLRGGKPYSVTTSGHMSAAARAIPDGAMEFTVKEVTGHYYTGAPNRSIHLANIRDFVERITTSIEQSNKARSSDNIVRQHGESERLIREVKTYCRVFKLKLPKLPKLPKLDGARLAVLREREVKRDQERSARHEAERKARNAEYLARHQQEQADWVASAVCTHTPAHDVTESHECRALLDRADWEAHRVELVQRWRAGETVRLRFDYDEPALLRLIQDKTSGRYYVETSQRVSVPVTGHSGAARLLKFLQATRQAGRTYKRNGHSEHIGNFVVDSFDGETLMAGCHRIVWAEIEALAVPVIMAAAVELNTPGPETQPQTEVIQ